MPGGKEWIVSRKTPQEPTKQVKESHLRGGFRRRIGTTLFTKRKEREEGGRNSPVYGGILITVSQWMVAS